MADLPDPVVNVTTEDGKTNVTISREGSGRRYDITSITESGKIAEAVRKVIQDPYTAEWLPKEKRS
jgi:hypothetical protein